jgi:hypothetical protein
MLVITIAFQNCEGEKTQEIKLVCSIEFIQFFISLAKFSK